MVEFTGERVIPGLVDDDLFNEHLSRYKFAARLMPAGAAVLDLGCGTGYGSAEFAAAGSVTAADISAEAVEYARANFGRSGVEFIQASCDALPLDEAFDLITAFEVIEHLDDWRGLAREAQRLLKPGGLFVVSTPNRSYYAETRGKNGPNPFHVHEFEHDEFQAGLGEFFPEVRIWTQNHAEAILFAPANPSGAALDAKRSQSPETSHFFVAVCGTNPIGPEEVFAWVPLSGNVLRERERHIAKLEGELEKKDQWLQTALTEHASTVRELQESNGWAATLNGRIGDLEGRIEQLQNEANERLSWIRRLEADVQSHADWAHRLGSELAEKIEHVKLLMGESAELNGHVAEMQRVARESQGRVQVLQDVVTRLQSERAHMARSRWLKLGTALHLGPVLPDGE